MATLLLQLVKSLRLALRRERIEIYQTTIEESRYIKSLSVNPQVLLKRALLEKIVLLLALPQG